MGNHHADYSYVSMKTPSRKAAQSLIEEDFAVLLASPYRVSKPSSTAGFCPWTLKKTTIPPNSIIHAVLGGAMEF